MKRRILSIITALALCLSLCPTWALAAEADPSLCKHHPEHTEDCGYTAPAEGHDCGHEHTEDCYTTDEAGGKVLDCHHSHNSGCGYVQDDPGTPCGYECRICPIEDLIAALPEQVTADNAADVRARLDEILALYGELNEDEQDQIDLSRIYALQGALDAANAPMQAAEEVTINNATVKTLTAEDGDCQGHTFTGTAQGTTIYVASGAHDVTFSGLNITETANVGVAPGATMNLTIEGANTIKSSEAGIYVPVGATLVINGNGSLNVSGNVGGAGIGGAVYVPDGNYSAGDPNCGTVEIKGGTVTATGGRMAAGIGGGIDTEGNPGNGGNVTINGGAVTAAGGVDASGNYGGAGIGGGAGETASSRAGSGGTLTISGGHVTLTAGNSTSYGFGQGTGRAPGGTCELTLTDASYLDSSTTLDPNGKYTINGGPTEDMIVVPEDLVYNGKAQELDGKIYIDDSKTGTGTYFNQTFAVKASADGWELQDLGEVVNAGTYTATFKKGDKEISKTFTVAQSGTQFVGDGEVKTYNGETETDSFSASDTITVKATPTATGEAPQKAAARLRADPTAGQMAVFVGDVQVSEPVGAEADGTYTMTVSAAEVLLKGNVEPNGNAITLTAKFVGNGNMADGAGTATVSITAAAKAEKGGTVIGYYGESNLNAAFADSGNADATITLLSDVEPSTYLTIQIDCTLDLGGHTITGPMGRSQCVIVETNTAVTIRGEGEITAPYGIALTVNGSVTLEGGTYTSVGSEFPSVHVMGQSAMLSVTGEKVSIRNTSDGCGLIVAQAQSVRLSAGTYSGTAGAISSTVKLSDMLAHTNNIRYAYYQGDALVTTGLDGQALTGTVTVKECTHAYQYAHTTGTTTHSQTCPACGDAKASEKCDFSNGPCPCGAVLAVTLPADLNLTYNGTAQEPGVTVTVDGTPLAASNYEVTYADNINAGTNAAKVTVTGKNYTGTTTLTFSIGKATPTIEWNPKEVTLTYTGQPANIKPVITLVNGETYTGEIHYSWGGVADSLVPPTNSGSYAGVTASIPEQNNYTAAKITTFTLILYIDPADQAAPDAPTATDDNIKDTRITLTAVENAEYKRDNGEWQESPMFTGLDPNQAYTFYARLKEDRNHNASPSSAGTSITTKKMMLDNAAVTVSGTYIYNGAAQTPTVTVVKNGKALTAGIDYTAAYANNTNAGTAAVTVTGMGDYEGTNSTAFAIQRKALTAAGAIAAGRPYNGTNTVTITGVTLSGIVDGDDVSVSTSSLTGTLNGTDAGN